jgi:hypothetical protein
MSRWTLFSNHGHVLLYLAGDPESRLRDVAAAVGITERAVQKIVRDLQDAAILSVSKQGRRNRYRVNTRKPLRHELESHRTVGDLVDLIKADSAKPRRKTAEPAAVTMPAPAEPEQPAVSVPGPTPGDLPDREPPPIPEPVAAPEAEPQPAAGTPVQRMPEPSPPAAKIDRPKKKRKRTPPVDEQQGSLF